MNSRKFLQLRYIWKARNDFRFQNKNGLFCVHCAVAADIKIACTHERSTYHGTGTIGIQTRNKNASPNLQDNAGTETPTLADSNQQDLNIVSISNSKNFAAGDNCFYAGRSSTPCIDRSEADPLPGPAILPEPPLFQVTLLVLHPDTRCYTVIHAGNEDHAAEIMQRQEEERTSVEHHSSSTIIPQPPLFQISLPILLPGARCYTDA